MLHDDHSEDDQHEYDDKNEDNQLHEYLLIRHGDGAFGTDSTH